MRFSDITKISRANYRCDVPFRHLRRHFNSWTEACGTVDFDPPYQRGYVWTQEQQIAYLEFVLKGGMGGRDIFFNCTTWNSTFDTPVELVDGKQRLQSVLDFLDNKIPVFGYTYKKFEDKLDLMLCFSVHVNDLTNPYDVVRWYLDMNTGGSIHTEKDLEPAYQYLNQLGVLNG